MKSREQFRKEQLTKVRDYIRYLGRDDEIQNYIKEWEITDEELFPKRDTYQNFEWEER